MIYDSFTITFWGLVLMLIFQKQILAFIMATMKPFYKILFGSKFDKWWPKFVLFNKIIYIIGAVTIILAFIISWDMQR